MGGCECKGKMWTSNRFSVVSNRERILQEPVEVFDKLLNWSVLSLTEKRIDRNLGVPEAIFYTSPSVCNPREVYYYLAVHFFSKTTNLDIFLISFTTASIIITSTFWFKTVKVWTLPYYVVIRVPTLCLESQDSGFAPVKDLRLRIHSIQQ